MESTLVNFIINKFLSNFLEINPKQTNISLLSGEFIFKNVKIKQNLFKYVNLDYLELITSYIGSMKILLSLPNFYSSPIKVYINDIFIYSKQKNIDNIKEKDRIESLIKNKIYNLTTDENLIQQINEIIDTSDSFVNQIIKNINIFVKNIIFRFEDEISSPKTPFAIGLIMKTFNIISNDELYNDELKIEDELKSDYYKSEKSSRKNIIDLNNVYISDYPYEIIDKKIIIDRFYLYIDYYETKEELNFNKFIDDRIKVKTSEEFEYYINDILNFYYYCKSELNFQRKNKQSHEYIFYNLNLDINFSMNFNLENNNPKFKIIINDIKNFDIYLKIQQLSLLFNLLSYYNLYYYYIVGLNQTIFNLSLNKTEKKTYVLNYLDYYYNKYVLKNNSFALSESVKEQENKMPYEDIKELRKIAIKNIKLFEKLKEKEKALNKSKNSWSFFTKNENEIKRLESIVKDLKNLLNEKIINNLSKNKIAGNEKLKEKYSKLDIEEDLIEEKDPLENLPSNFILYIFKMKIHTFHIIIYNDESEIINADPAKNESNVLIDINIIDFFINFSKGIQTMNLIFDLFDMSISQEIIKSNDYNIIFYTEKNISDPDINKKKLLTLEFETKTDENYSSRIFLKNERKIIFILNLFEINYIKGKIFKALYTSISFIDLSHYDENINKYLKIGYLVNESKKKNTKKNIPDNVSENDKYSNYKCNINIISPMIIMPQNILDIYNNKCIVINVGDISVESSLIEKKRLKKIQSCSVYEICSDDVDESVLSSESENNEDFYDKYNVLIKGFNVDLSYECLKKNNFYSKNNSNLINNVDISLIYKTLIIPSEPGLNKINLLIDINQIDFNLDEFQLLALIVFFKQMKTQSNLLIKILSEDNEKNNENNKLIKDFKEQLIERGILQDEDISEEEVNENKYIDSYTTENDFLTKKNEYLYEVKINKIVFNIYKIYPDLENYKFLEFNLNDFNYKMCQNSIKDSFMKISIRILKLFDKEKNINNKFISIKDYQTLIENKNDYNTDMFSYSNIFINNLKENKSELNLCNMNMIMTLNTLTRIYIFSMYYYNMFYENYLNANASTASNKNNIEINTKNNDNSKNINNVDKDILSENNKKKIIYNTKFMFKINLKENYFLLPYDISTLACPILSFKLNMAYEQSKVTEIIKIFENKKKEPIKIIQKPNNSYMNIMIYESNFDLINYDILKKTFKYNKNEDKILSNYRIIYTNKYINIPESKQSLSNMDILIEPILINICLDQLKDLLLFYNQLMKFLYENLYEIYIPYVKPENIISYKGKKYIKKKNLTLKKIFWRVYIIVRFKKSFNKKIKDKKALNSTSNININMNRAKITIFSNENNSKRLLMELIMSKMYYKSINNTNPKSKINTTNELINVLSGIDIPLNDYIIHQLYKYMDISFIAHFNYYNLEYSTFEPIIEPLPFRYLAYQVDKIFRHKTLIESDNMINFNVSPDCIKVVNLFLSKYYSEKELMNKESKSASVEFNFNINNDLKKEDKIVLKIVNKTGLPIRFWFDFKKKEKYVLNNKDYITFTNSTLYENRRQQTKIQKKNPERNTFSFQLLGYEVIPNININKNNTLYLKTPAKDKYLLYNVKVDTSEMINKIKFYSSLSFINKTIFDEMIISIDDRNIKDNYIKLKKGKNLRIPLSWMLSDKKIFIQMNKNGQKDVLYNNIFECIFCQKLNKEELEKVNKEKEEAKENLSNELNNNKEINLQHPKYKEYISSVIDNKFNNSNLPEYFKKITIIDKNKENKSFSFGFNYYALSNKEHQDKKNDEIYSKLTDTEKSYKYHIIIKPIITIYNFIPFNIFLNPNFPKDTKNSLTTKLNLDSLKKEEIYDSNWILNKEMLITFNLNHYNNIYSSDNFPLIDEISNENIIRKIKLTDKKSNTIISNIMVKYSESEEENLNEVIEQYSLSSLDFIFFFDYIVNNRMDFDIYSKEMNENEENEENAKNNENNKTYLFKQKNLSLLSNYHDILCLNINSENKNYDENNQFLLKSIGINKNIEVNINNSTYNISCTALSSINYIYSNIIIFEPKYILVNKLDFDLFYSQDIEAKEKKKIKKNGKVILSYDNNIDKKLFRLGLKNDNKKFSWSGPFDLDESKDYDYKIEINNELYEQYKKNCYKTGNKNYIFFRIKIKIYQYTTYIIISFTEFPCLEIKNRTSQKIKIYETEETKGPLPLIIDPRKDIPFIWEDITDIKEQLICLIIGKKVNFSFSNFEESIIPFNENKEIHIGVKRNKTGSRILILEEKNVIKKKSDYFMKKQSKSLSLLTVKLKGIGLSFIDETPKEVFFISFYGMKFIKKNILILSNMENIQQFNLSLKNFQIDYCLNDSLKSLIYPKIQQIPSLEEQRNPNDKLNQETLDFITIMVDRTSYSDLENKVLYMNYNKIALFLEEMNLKINQTILIGLLNLIQEYYSLLDYNKQIQKKNKKDLKEDNLIENNDKNIENLLKENLDSNSILIYYLILSRLKINLTFRIDFSNIEISFLPDFLSNIILSLGSSLIRISDSPINFDAKVIKDIYMDTNLIISRLKENYMTEAIFQVYKILGSTDLIGNPVNLIDKIGGGFYELVNIPTKSLMNDPSEFGIGLAKGVGGLLNGVVGGSMDSVSKITGTLYSTVHGILGKKQGLINDDNENDEPENLIIGATKGIEDGYKEIKEGVTGAFINPFVRAKNLDAIGFIKEFGMGLFGLAVSPITFALKLGGSLATGTKNTFGLLCNKILKNKRFRFPRYIEESKPLGIYDEDLSAAKEFLTKLVNIENPKILYFSSFICNNPGYTNKLAFLIVTKELFLILSNQNEILWNIKIKDVQNIELFYDNGNFKIIIAINNEKSRILIIDKSCVVVTCNFFDLINNEIDNFE